MAAADQDAEPAVDRSRRRALRRARRAPAHERQTGGRPEPAATAIVRPRLRDFGRARRAVSAKPARTNPVEQRDAQKPLREWIGWKRRNSSVNGH
jgi:hypothetical protein